MPVNLDALKRYHILNECFANKFGKYTIEKLQAAIFEHVGKEISARTISEDIRVMKSDELGYNAPIIYNSQTKTYCYSDPNYSIKNCTLNQQAIKDISFALSIINEYKGFSFFDSLEGIFNHLEANIYAQTKANVHKFIDFEKHTSNQGLQHLKPLMDAILHQNILKINYQRFIHDTPKEHIFHPYFLKEYQHRWYVLGLLEKKNSLITFALDRIQLLEFLPEQKYIPNTQYNFETLFQNSIGINEPLDEPKEVILSFSPLAGKYFKTQPFYPEYEILEESDNQLLVKMTLHLNIELEKLILANLGEVKVLAPLELKEKIEERVRKFLGE